jgi:hypothetical protein
MGQAKIRKAKLGAIYGTPEGSNSYVAPFVCRDRLKRLSSDNPAKAYLTMSPANAHMLRQEVATQTILACEPNIRRKLLTLPPDFSDAFLRLFGHVLINSRQFEDWKQIAKDLKVVSCGIENRKALADWKCCPNEYISHDSVSARHACYAILQQITNDFNVLEEKRYRNNMYACACLADPRYIIMNAIPNHLVAVSSIEAGYLLHRAGSLFLFDSAGDRPKTRREGERDTLWLTRKRPDGIHALAPMANIGGLKPSEIKSMRNFITSYSGKIMVGELNPGRESSAAKICKAIGLTVEGKQAFIGR